MTMWAKIYDFFDMLWGYPMLILLVGGGLYFGIRTGFFQIRCLPMIFRKTFGEMFKKDKRRETGELEGTLTPYQALSTVLAGTVGSGNIAGVATAIAVGGPGALFWMWVTAIFGMMTKLAEVALSIRYREKGEDGEFYGGPMYYIKKGLGRKWAWLAGIYSAALLLLVLTDASFVQVNTAATALDDAFGVPLWLTGVVIVAVSLLVVIGGTKRIGEFCGKVVPPMCVLYIVGCVVVIIAHASNLGGALGMVFRYAFRPMAAVGGFAGSTIMMTMTKGGARGIFSNEAGEGTAATVHATAKTDHPIHQGFYGVVEVFIDTIIICTLTGLAILCTGDIWSSGETGVYLTFAAFRETFGNIGVYVAGICVFLFAYSSYLGFFVEFRTSLEYIFKEKAAKYLKWLFFVPPIISCVLPVSAIWDLADMVVGFIFIPNMIAILALSPQVLSMLREYTAQCRAERAARKDLPKTEMDKLMEALNNQQQHFNKLAAQKEAAKPVESGELTQIFSTYFAKNVEFFSNPGDAKYNAYFGAINTAVNEIQNNPQLLMKAAMWDTQKLAALLSEPIPGITNMLVCGLIFKVGEYAVIFDRVYCVDFSEQIPNCIALYMLLIAQKQPPENRNQLIDAGDGTNPEPLRKALDSLKVCDDNWDCRIL